MRWLHLVQTNQIIIGDALTELRKLPDESANCCITSPPYYMLRDYDCAGQIGLEQSLDEYVEKLVAVFAEVRRVLTDDGTLWLNLGDTYADTSTLAGTWDGGERAKRGGFSKKQQSNTGSYERKDVKKWHKQARNKGTHRRPKIIDNRQGNPEFDRPGRSKVRRPASKPAQQGIKCRDLMLVPATVAIALRKDGWFLRNEIIWAKTNPMPESVGRPGGRFTRAHEFIYLFGKCRQYHLDADAVKEPYAQVSIERLNRAFTANEERGYVGGGRQHLTEFNSRMKRETDKDGRDSLMRNMRDVWSLPVSTYKGAHFATFSPAVVERALLAGCPEEGVVLDPFFGSGTVGEIANKHRRRWIGIELNPEYLPLIKRRTGQARLTGL